MDRRSFLGSVIGTLVGSQIPFVAAETKSRPISEKLKKAEAMLHVFQVSESELYKYRLYALTDKGIKFWAPPITTVNRDFNILKCEFVAETMIVNQPITLVGAGLIDPVGRLVGAGTFPRQCSSIVGDELTVHYDTGFNG